MRATAEALRQVLGRLATSLDGPPYNLVLHTAPLREQVDATYHWHWEIHPRLREIAGLELGTGLPVNPVSPEDAVEELLGRAEPHGRWDGLKRARPATGGRHMGGACLVLCPSSVRSPSTTLRRHRSPHGAFVAIDPSVADLRDPLGRSTRSAPSGGAP